MTRQCASPGRVSEDQPLPGDTSTGNSPLRMGRRGSVGEIFGALRMGSAASTEGAVGAKSLWKAIKKAAVGKRRVSNDDDDDDDNRAGA